MSLDTRLAALEQRHTALDAEIATLILQPAKSETEIQEKKRKKLVLKEEIERLRGGMS